PGQSATAPTADSSSSAGPNRESIDTRSTLVKVRTYSQSCLRYASATYDSAENARTDLSPFSASTNSEPAAFDCSICRAPSRLDARKDPSSRKKTTHRNASTAIPTAGE